MGLEVWIGVGDEWMMELEEWSGEWVGISSVSRLDGSRDPELARDLSPTCQDFITKFLLHIESFTTKSLSPPNQSLDVSSLWCYWL